MDSYPDQLFVDPGFDHRVPVSACRAMDGQVWSTTGHGDLVVVRRRRFPVTRSYDQRRQRDGRHIPKLDFLATRYSFHLPDAVLSVQSPSICRIPRCHGYAGRSSHIDLVLPDARPDDGDRYGWK